MGSAVSAGPRLWLARLFAGRSRRALAAAWEKRDALAVARQNLARVDAQLDALLGQRRALEAQADAALNASALRAVQDRIVALRDREAGLRRDRGAAAAAVEAAEAEFAVYAKAYRKASGKSERGEGDPRRRPNPLSRPSGGLA